MAFRYALPLRAVQGLLVILILGLTAYDVSLWSPSETNFLLFCAIWTLLAVFYLLLAPKHFPTAGHKFGILAAETLTMIFWFAGFIAEAVLLTDTGCHRGSLCRTMQAATVFAAFEWFFFVATTIMASLHVWRTRNTSDQRADPQMAGV